MAVIRMRVAYRFVKTPALEFMGVGQVEAIMGILRFEPLQIAVAILSSNVPGFKELPYPDVFISGKLCDVFVSRAVVVVFVTTLVFRSSDGV